MSERDFIKNHLLSQIEDLQRRVAELERFTRVLDDGHVGVVNNLYNATDGAGLFDGDDDLVAPNGARIAGGLYVGSTATAPIDGCVHITGNLVGTTISLADDAATSITPATTVGMILLLPRTGSTTLRGMVVFRATSSPFAYLLVGNYVEATTGALTGTTGSDIRFTVSTHTDGKVYLENRLGVEVSFHYIFMGA
jgi:hypothetical protein